MNTTVSRVLCGAALLLASCGGGGTNSDLPEEGAIVKMSYFRALPEPRTKKLEAVFRVVMSETWRDRMGDGPREPLAKAAPGKIYMGYVPDRDMVRYYKKLKELGLDDLKSRDPGELKPADFSRMALDAQETAFTRVLTVGVDKTAKSYWYRDQQVSKDLIEKFYKCEMFISRACEYAIQVRTLSDPLQK